MNKCILSLFDYKKTWSKPYEENGYEVVIIDLKHGVDIITWNYKLYKPKHFYGILAAPPCTDFAGSGARWWKEKDKDGRTNYSCILIHQTLAIIKYFNSEFWALENPVGRIEKLVPEMKQYRLLSFNPCDFGDPYTKKTILYGKFNPFLTYKPVKPTEGSKMHKLPPSEKRQEIRSTTPLGFAYAFYEANKI